MLHINHGHVLVLVTASAAFTRHLLLKFDLLEEVVLLLLLDGVMTADLGGLLLVPGRRHACLEVARRALRIALRQPQHVLHLDILQILLYNRLGLLLVMARGQA